MIVCFCNEIAALICVKLVPVLTSDHSRRTEACTEFETGNSRNTENELSDIILKSVKYGRTYAGRNIHGSTFDHSAERLPCFTGFFNIVLHKPASAVVDDREVLASYAPYTVTGYVHRIVRVVLYIMYARNVSAGVDAAAFEYLSAYSSGEAERDSESLTKMSLIAEIIKALVAHSSGVISVTGTRKSVNIRVLRSFYGSVLYKGTERSSGSPVVVNTRHNVRHYILVVIDETNISPRHKPGYRFDINMLSGRETVNGYTDGRSL